MRHNEKIFANKSTKLVHNAQQQISQTASGAKAVRHLMSYAENLSHVFEENNSSRAQKTVIKLRRRPPLYIRFTVNAYHKYGLKHIILVLFFLFYIFFGALLFLVIEAPYQNELKYRWEKKIAVNRKLFTDDMMKDFFNNSRFLLYIKGRTTHILTYLEYYEKSLNIRWTEQKLTWNYWNSVLFAGTICTTIGYGHIYPSTNAGRILTMVYSLGGIPLVLLLLQDLGNLLTIFMKYPWFQFKRFLRRALRLITKQSLSEIAFIEMEERNNLRIFDVPIPVAVGLVVIWLWICSSVFCYLDKRWTFLEAFYFFFISLSTIGLGDMVPSSPNTLISMFGLIVFGLSLVSMVLNLLQSKMRSTYEGQKISTEGETIFGPALGIIQV
ncbi:unnamed protein product [Dracunculus medinensis]|uniref:Ion channel n=1 Tax=Dracunculus medinensis TaxID=318479 RepID=A0A0N4U0S2_DRAME|nr:unnamed protein product [Dracunculus medinensis]